MARIVAAAQYGSAGDFEGNVEKHVRFAQVAASLGVALLVYPELSLTGCELERAAGMAMRPYDVALEPLRMSARELGLTLMVGAPVAMAGVGDGRPGIGQVVFLPDGLVVTYTKQELVGEQARWFQSGTGGPVLKIGSLRVGSAIGAEISRSGQAAGVGNGVGNGLGIYAASVQLSGAEAGLLAGYARQHGVTVVMANHAAGAGTGELAGGRSAIWDDEGRLVAQSDGSEEALVVARRRGRTWEGTVFPMAAKGVGRDLETGEGMGASVERGMAQRGLFDGF